MRWFLLLIFTNVSFVSVAQFTYFNQLDGELTDPLSEVSANVEVVDGNYFVWGAGIDSDMDILYHFVRKYDEAGNIIDEIILVHENQYVLSGVINSFEWNPFTETFVYIHGTNRNNGCTEGYLIELDQNLDTTFTRRYDQYPPYTYPFIFEVENDGYIVAGEQGGLDNSDGTFLMKLGFDGIIIWSEILQAEVYQHIYRNWGIVETENGYCLAGGSRDLDGYFGLLTTTDFEGNTLSETFVVDENELRTYQYKGLEKLANGEIMTATTVGYADVEQLGNPDVFWTKTRLSKFDPETQDIYWQQDYHSNFEFINGGVADIEATPDGGAVISGGRYGWYFDEYAWMMKVDSSGNEEWFHEYTYEICNDCSNNLGDIELTEDGGYILAGHFANYAIDPRNSTWLLKVDACGDVEWQGCELLGVSENQPNVFKIYPNPSTGSFTLENATQANLASWKVYDVSGGSIASGNSNHQATSLQIDINVPSGMYNLELVMENGERENHKIQVIK